MNEFMKHFWITRYRSGAVLGTRVLNHILVKIAFLSSSACWHPYQAHFGWVGMREYLFHFCPPILVGFVLFIGVPIS